MFMSSSESESQSQSILSLPTALTYDYLWCILFEWDVDVEFPFDIFQIGSFPTSELKPNWISGELDELSRRKKIKFKSLPGRSFSLFAKVEKC